MEQDKVQKIIDKMDGLEEQLSKISDDMFLRINHRDNESLEKGTNLLKDFNSNVEQFREMSNRIKEQIKVCYGIGSENDELEQDKEVAHGTIGYDEHMARELLKEHKCYSLDANFSKTKPYGFILENMIVRKDINKWADLYTDFLSALYRSDENRFREMAYKYHNHFTNRKGYKKKRRISSPREIERSDIFAVVNSNTEQKRKNMREFLKYFNLDLRSMKIFIVSGKKIS